MSSHPADTSASAEKPAEKRRHDFTRGIKLGLPVFLGYVPVGMAFGILARTVGFTWLESVLCSATALAGAGQFIALSLLGSHATLVSTLIATGVVNLRYVLFGSTLSPRIKGVRLPVLGWLSFTLTDETFAINAADLRQGTASTASMAGVGAISWVGWVLGTVVGAAGASWIGDPSRFGVDFAMPAMFAALFIALAEDRRHIATGIFAGAVVLCLPLLARVGVSISSSWFIVIASIVGATVATAVFTDE